MSSLRMPTARWVLPVPIPPTSSNPLPSRGSNSCTKRDALIWASETERSAPGKSIVKFDSSQCSYLFGMRAAAIMALPRACIWQLQRVTPRSGVPGTGFHPDPAHKGQTSAPVFIVSDAIICYSIAYLNSAPEPAFAATRNRFLPVHILWRRAASCGEQRGIAENFDLKTRTNSALGTFVSFSNHYTVGHAKVSKPATGTCFPLTIPSHGREWPSPVLAP